MVATGAIFWGMQKIIHPPHQPTLLFLFCFVTTHRRWMSIPRTFSHLVLNKVVLVLWRLALWGREVEWLCMSTVSRVLFASISWLVDRRRRRGTRSGLLAHSLTVFLTHSLVCVNEPTSAPTFFLSLPHNPRRQCKTQITSHPATACETLKQCFTPSSFSFRCPQPCPAHACRQGPAAFCMCLHCPWRIHGEGEARRAKDRAPTASAAVPLLSGCHTLSVST